MCNLADKTDLVSYVYGELDRAAHAAFEQHLRTCSECRLEVEGLRAVRTDLTAWAPPEPTLAFRIVAEPREAAGRVNGTVLRPVVPAWRRWLTPAAGFAAAAVLVLAAAAGLARIEVHGGPDGWTLTTGASPEAFTSSAVAPTDGMFARTSARDVRLAAPHADLDALERRISALEATSRDTAGVRNASMTARAANDEEILKVVRELLAQSEGRQKTELALRISQVLRDVQAQRVADLNRFQQGLGRIDATVADEAAAHRELMNFILTSNTSNPRTK